MRDARVNAYRLKRDIKGVKNPNVIGIVKSVFVGFKKMKRISNQVFLVERK